MKRDVLIVDDDAFTLKGIASYLETLDYVPRCAGDAQTAWQMALDRPPQTAVIDIRLPVSAQDADTSPTEAHGIALARRLKRSFPTLPVVLLSAHAQYEREVARLAPQFAGSVAFLHKGGDMSRLHHALQEVRAGRTVFQTDMVNHYVLETAVRDHLSSDERYWVDQALEQFDHLSPREQKIAYLLAASYSPDHIAAELNLARGSVDNAISRLYAHLGLTDMKKEDSGLRRLPILVKVCLLHDIRRHSARK